MTGPAIPTPAERTAAVRVCARLGLQPNQFSPDEWLDIALKAEPMGMPRAYPSDDYLAMAALAERFPGATFH